MSATPRTDLVVRRWQSLDLPHDALENHASELERENAALHAQLEHYKMLLDEARDHLNREIMEVNALREDKARLDWLEDNCACRGGGSGATYSFCTPADVEHGLLRAAIDAARGGKL